MLNIIHLLPDQIKEGLQLGKYIKLDLPINHIIFTGMGGSGLPGEVLNALIKNMPSTVINDYHLPLWADKNTLIVCFSYSGNTEETISCFKEALKKNFQTIIVTTGGRIKLIADEADVRNKIMIPRGIPSRQAIGYFVFALITVFQNHKLINITKNEIDTLIETLKKPGFDEQAEKLAEQLKNKIPIIYTTKQYQSVALRWKQSFNENSKSHSFFNILPEMNHNEIMGYRKTNKDFHIIFLIDESEDKQIIQRVELSKDIIKQAGNTVTEIKLKGSSHLIKVFTAIFLGDLTSVYLAKHYAIDPLETNLIEQLKKRLKS